MKTLKEYTIILISSMTTILVLIVWPIMAIPAVAVMIIGIMLWLYEDSVKYLPKELNDEEEPIPLGLILLGSLILYNLIILII